MEGEVLSVEIDRGNTQDRFVLILLIFKGQLFSPLSAVHHFIHNCIIILHGICEHSLARLSYCMDYGYLAGSELRLPTVSAAYPKVSKCSCVHWIPAKNRCSHLGRRRTDITTCSPCVSACTRARFYTLSSELQTHILIGLILGCFLLHE